MSKILIIIPAFNEASAIGKVIDQIHQSGVVCDVVVIDDGSRDNTAIVAEARGVRVLKLPFNLGIGGAVQTGFKYAYVHGYDMAIQLDGDGQHDAAYLPQLMNPILTKQADLVIGSRFLEPSKGFQSTMTRRVGISFFVKLINFLTGTTITDPTSGFRAHSKRLIAIFAQYYPHDFPEPEAIVVAKRAQANIQEVSVEMRARQGGSSSIGSIKSVYYMLKVTVAIVLHMMRRQDL